MASAILTPAPWRFKETRAVPRGHAIRKAIAANIQALRREAQIGFNIRKAVMRQRREWREQCRASVWTRERAVGCVETGELFVNAYQAARAFAVGRTLIVRSCGDG